MLAASTAFGAVLAAMGPREKATTLVGTNCYGVVGLVILDLTVIKGGSRHRKELLVAVDGGCASVRLVRQGTAILMGVLGELKTNCCREAAHKH